MTNSLTQCFSFSKMTFSLNLICDVKVFASHKNETIPLLVKNRICNSLAFLAELLLVLKDLGTERISPAALRSCFWCRRTWELNGFHWLRGFTKEADGIQQGITASHWNDAARYPSCMNFK